MVAAWQLRCVGQQVAQCPAAPLLGATEAAALGEDTVRSRCAWWKEPLQEFMRRVAGDCAAGIVAPGGKSRCAGAAGTSAAGAGAATLKSR